MTDYEKFLYGKTSFPNFFVINWLPKHTINRERQLFSYRLTSYKKKFYLCIFKYDGIKKHTLFGMSRGSPPIHKISQIQNYTLDYMPSIFEQFTSKYLLILRVSRLETLNKMLNNKYKYLIKNQNYAKL